MIILQAPESKGVTPKGSEYLFTVESFSDASIGQSSHMEEQRILYVGGEQYLGSLNPGATFKIDDEYFSVES